MKNYIDCETVMKIAQSRSMIEAWDTLRNFIIYCGFDHTIFATNRLRRKGVFGDRSHSHFLSDLPKPLMDLLWDEQIYMSVPVALWAAQNTGTVSLKYGSDLYHAGELTPDQTRTQKRLMEAGITSGYVIALHDENAVTVSILGLLNFGRSQEEADLIWENEGSKIEAIGAIFGLKANSLPLPLKNKSLTERQSEVVKWIGEGKTMQEVATILGISSATIEKHLKQARETLGVATTTQAVLHAQINSQIFTTQG